MKKAYEVKIKGVRINGRMIERRKENINDIMEYDSNMYGP